MQVIIQADSMADFNQQVAALYHEANRTPTEYKEGDTGPNGGTVSNGQEWCKTESGGYSPQELPTTTEAPELAAAPTPGPFPTTPTTSTGDLDTNGLRWDKRIHSAAKSKNANGTWRNRRNIDKDLLAQVTAELMGGTTTTPLQVAPEPSLPPLAEPVTHMAPETSLPPTAAPVVETPQYNEVPTPTNTRPVHSLVTFTQNLPMVLTELIQKGSIDHNYVAQLNAHYGVNEIFEITKSPENTQSLFTYLVGQGLITEVA